ncbi:T9SS type A sorting domain-containing protein [Prolixibacteraceae bacterium JC049]|nr:T9SS type A sorting domain-containing protein [Prolixibacteraceae bacterium JC049]
MRKIFTTLLCTAAIGSGAMAQYDIDWAKTRNLQRPVTFEKSKETRVERRKVEQTALTATGVVYTAGQATEDFDFANNTIGTLGGGSSYLLKYAADGTEAWGAEILGASYVTQVTATTDEGVIVAGRFAGEIDIKGTDGNKQTLTKKEYTDKHPFAFVARYDKDGKVVWAKAFETALLAGEDTPVFGINNLKVEGEKVVFTGYFDGKVTVDGKEYSTTQYDVWGIIFYANFSSYTAIANLETGEVEKFLPVNAKGGRTNRAEGVAVEMDNAGNTYVANLIQGEALIPDTDHTISTELDDTGASFEFAKNIYVVKYDNAGAVVWTKNYSTELIKTEKYEQNIFSVSDMQLNADQKLVLTGNYSGNLPLTDEVKLTANGDDITKADNYLMILSETNGDLVKAVSFGSVEGEGAPALAIGEDRMFIAGEYEGDMKFNSRTISSKGASDIFVASFENDGTPVIALSMGTTEADYFTSFAGINDKTVAVSGIYKGTLAIENTEVASTGDTYDSFVLKMQNASDFPTSTTEEVNNAQKPLFFPNPAKSQIQVKNADKISIYSIAGTLVYTSNQPSTVDVSQLKAGMYLVNLHKGNDVTSVKLIKK